MTDTSPLRPAPDDVARCYARGDIMERIRTALAAAGLGPGGITVEALAPVDHFHTRGHAATLVLAELAGLRRGDRVLDLGGGIGGPARTLAAALGCRVTVLDLTPEYCDVGRELTRLTGLDDAVTFVTGDATAPPLPPAGFDVVWTQHSSMNMPHKPALYRAAAAMLAPGGRLALHEIVAGGGGAPHFPVPWAAAPALSHLLPAARHRAAIGEADFEELVWRDVTAPTIAWARERLAAGATGPLGPHVLLGERTRPAFENLARSMEEGRIAVVEGVFRKRSR